MARTFMVGDPAPEHADLMVVGDVLAIEPGLRDRRVGRVTFEDLVLVTET